MVKREYGGKKERKKRKKVLTSGSLAECGRAGRKGVVSSAITIAAVLGGFIEIDRYFHYCFVIMESAFPSTFLHISAGIVVLAFIRSHTIPP